jgi:hypothetical protein
METQSFVLCDNMVKIYKVADLEVIALQGGWTWRWKRAKSWL